MVFCWHAAISLWFSLFLRFFGSDFFSNCFCNPFIVHSRPSSLFESNFSFWLVFFCSMGHFDIDFQFFSNFVSIPTCVKRVNGGYFPAVCSPFFFHSWALWLLLRDFMVFFHYVWRLSYVVFLICWVVLPQSLVFLIFCFLGMRNKEVLKKYLKYLKFFHVNDFKIIYTHMEENSEETLIFWTFFLVNPN